MVDHNDTFALFAELALGLAGFAGVAAAFGDRNRSYDPEDRNRLIGLFANSGIVLAGSLTILTLGATSVRMQNAFLVASTGAFAMLGITLLNRVPITLRLSRDPTTPVSPLLAHLTSFYLCVALLFYGSNFWLGGEAWPLLAGFSLQLIFGLWLFSRLLTRPM